MIKFIAPLAGLLLLASTARTQGIPPAGDGGAQRPGSANTGVAALSLLESPSAVRPLPSPDDTRILRFPATNGRQVVFSYADQLYTVGLEGGLARRLTNGPGYAIFPRFSPDGTQLAFTAQYDGNTEVYLMPADGGAPKRLTYTATLDRDDLGDRMGPNNIAMAWKNRAPEIAFRSRMRSFNPFIGQLFTVGTDGDLPRQLPVPRGGFMSFSPDDTKMAYNRVFREFRAWKDYRGGMADDIWIYDFKTGAIEDITNNPAQDIIPMWGPNNRIYFLSDRTGRMNLFSYDLATRATVQHTDFRDFDVKFPSLGGGVIVFEEAGFVWSFDTRNGTTLRIPIAVRDDLVTARTSLVNVAKNIESVSPSPDGKRVVVNARGHTFTVPAKDGPTRDLGGASGVHERDAVWSPDGKWIAYDSDATGENELYVRPQDGTGEPVQLTSGSDTYYFEPKWSPDSRNLLWSDRKQRLRYVTVSSKAVALVDADTALEIRQYAWSPDSAWVAWTRVEDEGLPRVWLFSLATGRKFPVTDGGYSSGAPAFSDDGRFLLLESSRDFKRTMSDIEFEYAYKDLQRVYLVALSKDTESPFKPTSDEVSVPAPPENVTETSRKAADKAPLVKVDEDGIMDRLIGLPVLPANYSSIRAVGDRVYYLRQQSVDAAPALEPVHVATLALQVYNLKDQKETALGEVTDYEISRDGKAMLVKIGKDYSLIELPTARFDAKDKLGLDGLEVKLERHAEWAEIYNESWRQMRDFFYSPTMNGVDWSAMRDKYAALLPYAQTRYDLTYLLSELVGELHISHTYVGGGDRPLAPRIAMGLLGAELSRDPGSRAYRIDHILKTDNWQESTRSPLTEIGVNVREGDYILAVDGKPVSGLSNIYSELAGKADQQVTLRVNSTPSQEGSRAVTIVPISDEGPLYYESWVKHNRDHVSQRTGGQVGYLHLPDMGPAGLNEFANHFPPQVTKRALIIDIRGNGGGNVSPMIIERLSRELVMFSKPRNADPFTNPKDMLLGPKLVLMDEFSASDGDVFPYRFRVLGLGKLVGKRTWGGVTGFNPVLPIVDGGLLTKPEFGLYSKDGKSWPIEGYGVDPDIPVDNDPATEFAGTDQQLDRAIDEILLELKANPRTIPPPPPFPDRS